MFGWRCRRSVAAPQPVVAVDPDMLPIQSALRFGKKPSSYPDVFGVPPLDDGGPSPTRDIDLCCAELGWGSVRAASIRGEAKRYLGEPRQDALLVCRAGRSKATGPETVVMAVADGVGQSDLSRTGAELACTSAAAFVESEKSVTAETIVGHVANSLNEWANRRNIDPDRLSTTLVLAIVVPTESGATGTIVSVGDSGATVYSEKGQVRVAQASGRSQSGIFQSGRVRALPRFTNAFVADTVELTSNSTLVLWTDGFQPLIELDASRDHYLQLFSGGVVPAPPLFLWHIDARIRTYDDDRTVAALWMRRPDERR